jgi:hypothetical protein
MTLLSTKSTELIKATSAIEEVVLQAIPEVVL